MERGAPQPAAAAGESGGRGWEPVDSDDSATDDSPTATSPPTATTSTTAQASHKPPGSTGDGAEHTPHESSDDERPSRSSSRRHLRTAGENRHPQHQSQPPPLVKRRPGQRIQLQRNQSTSSAHTLATLAAANAAAHGAGGALPQPGHEHIHHRKKQFVAHTGARLGGHAKRAVSKGSRTNLAGGQAGEKRRSAIFQHGPLALTRTASSNSTTSERAESKAEEPPANRQRGFIVGSAEDSDDEHHHKEPEPQEQPKQEPPPLLPAVKLDKGKQALTIDTSMPPQREVRDTPAMLPLHQHPPHAADPQVTTTIAKGQHATPLHHQSSTSTLATTTPPLTSHFLDSPGTSHKSSVSPQKRPGVVRSTSTVSTGEHNGSSVSQTSAVPLRTQQKLWLQRQSSQLSPPNQYTIPAVVPSAQPALNTTMMQATPQTPAFYTPILERTARDYSNVRRYRDPVGEGINRILNVKKFTNGNNAGNVERNESQLGLSQSLKDADSRRTKSWASQKNRGSMDDSEIKRGESEEEMLCRRMWGEGELLVSNE